MVALAYSQVNEVNSLQAIKAHRDLFVEEVGRLVCSASNAPFAGAMANSQDSADPKTN